MVVRWERVPNAILVVMVLAMSNIFCVAHSHLFTTIPAWRKERRQKEERRGGLTQGHYVELGCHPCDD